MRGLRLSSDLKKRHTRTVVVDVDLVVFVDRLGCVLLHLNPLDEDMVLVFLEVVEEEATVHHDGLVLLRDLVCLGHVSVHIVLPVELDLRQDATTKSQRGLNGEVKALLIQHWEHAWQAQIHEVSVSVRLSRDRVQGCYRGGALGSDREEIICCTYSKTSCAWCSSGRGIRSR